MNDTVEQIFKTWQDATLDTISLATQQVTNSESWFNAMNANMDVYNSGVKKVRQTVAASLEALDLPKREDLARLSAQVLAAETRAADCEDRLDRAEAELRATRAQFDATEGTLRSLQQRLVTLERKAAPTSPDDTSAIKTVKPRRKIK